MYKRQEVPFFPPFWLEGEPELVVTPLSMRLIFWALLLISLSIASSIFPLFFPLLLACHAV